ncbi:ABC transporter ATP-binding protein [Bosea sp. (in: a-proteobacteria)]|uniref:ABC transporter ATP-binding protein n=1 Tax=Bosea sp. (in: a-proteobacteria) TaxID=1871050 RepID=UPI002DDCC17B|nr:ATP-binding cassette domain-containing protein [Bosea sp. (in: a-proteobacteria)]HEV2512118.1 ATP-binding cassette domain-containing protein [Bosea sp. (in: a-proteobacteria)]
MKTGSALLSLENVVHRYSGVLALDGVDLAIAPASFTAVLGPNGAGKSTLALVASGALKPQAGRLSMEGQDVGGRAGERGLVDLGVALIPEGRRLFGQLTVEENLILGAVGAGRAERARRLARIYELMPEALRSGRQRAAITFSGGEQQMLAVGRALMASPRLVLVDEPSLGLAPILTDRVYALLSELRREGVAVVVFEQLATNAMKHADTIVVIDHGQISFRGGVDDEATGAALQIGYLGHG